MPEFTPHDRINKQMAPLHRRLSDLAVKNLYGTELDLLRITKWSPESFAGRNQDVLGHSEYKMKFDVITKCNIQYPNDFIEIFNSLDQTGDLQTNSFDLNNLLPVTLIFPMEGNNKEDGNAILTDDLIVDVKFDVNNNKIPIILQVKKFSGIFIGKHLVRIKADLSLFRRRIDQEFRIAIKSYLDRAYTDG